MLILMLLGWLLGQGKTLVAIFLLQHAFQMVVLGLRWLFKQKCCILGLMNLYPS